MLRSIIFLLAASGTMLGQQTLMFLKLANIDGDGTMQGYERQIEISGFSYDAEAGALNRITLSKRFDVSSPQLLQAAVTGSDIHDSVLTMLTSAGDILRPFAVVTFSGEVYVTAVRIQGQGTTPPMESITLTFKKAEWCYVSRGRNCESFPTRSGPTQ